MSEQQTAEEQRQTAATLAEEARRAKARADAAQAQQSVEANEPERMKHIREAIAASEDPTTRDRYEREAFQRTPAYKNAKEHARNALSEVHKVLTDMRSSGVTSLDPSDRADIIRRAGEGSTVSARMGAKLRAAAERMIDVYATSGNVDKAWEVARDGITAAASTAPHGFEMPDSTTGDPFDVSDIPRF